MRVAVLRDVLWTQRGNAQTGEFLLTVLIDITIAIFAFLIDQYFT